MIASGSDFEAVVQEAAQAYQSCKEFSSTSYRAIELKVSFMGFKDSSAGFATSYVVDQVDKVDRTSARTNFEIPIVVAIIEIRTKAASAASSSNKPAILSSNFD